MPGNGGCARLWFMRAAISLLITLGLGAQAGERMQIVRPAEYTGMCDASAAAALGSDLFVAASDENNTLRVYQRERPGPPVKSLNLDTFLQISRKSPEADLEAVARLGDRLFWIGSHGRNKNAKERLNRCRFFATDVLTGPTGDITLAPVGKPYKNLLRDLTADPRLARFELERAEDRAPKDIEGLNIEGLAVTPEGRLLIGFRNPIPESHALVVPLLNPNEVVMGSRAELGPPLLLDLGGQGIRDMICFQGTYLILAGSYRGGGEFRLYRWAGGTALPEQITVDGLSEYNPEAMILYPGKGVSEVQVLSDDGERVIDGIPGKQIKDPARRKFRSFWLRMED